MLRGLYRLASPDSLLSSRGFELPVLFALRSVATAAANMSEIRVIANGNRFRTKAGSTHLSDPVVGEPPAFENIHNVQHRVSTPMTGLSIDRH